MPYFSNGYRAVMRIREERQIHRVSDEVLALTAVIRPILTGVLYALKEEVVNEVGGYEHVKLFMLPRLYRQGDGDCGICFEYAVHEAISQADGRVLERIVDAARFCNVPGVNLRSILFGLEKNGAQQLIATAAESVATSEVCIPPRGMSDHSPVRFFFIISNHSIDPGCGGEGGFYPLTLTNFSFN
jgi:hypothetical protein